MDHCGAQRRQQHPILSWAMSAQRPSLRALLQKDMGGAALVLGLAHALMRVSPTGCKGAAGRGCLDCVHTSQLLEPLRCAPCHQAGRLSPASVDPAAGEPACAHSHCGELHLRQCLQVGRGTPGLNSALLCLPRWPSWLLAAPHLWNAASPPLLPLLPTPGYPAVQAAGRAADAGGDHRGGGRASWVQCRGIQGF